MPTSLVVPPERAIVGLRSILPQPPVDRQLARKLLRLVSQRRPNVLDPLRARSSQAGGWFYCSIRHAGTTERRITSVFPRVARGFKDCLSFMFTGCCWWPSLVVDGGSGTSRGHALVTRRPGSRWSGAVAGVGAVHLVTRYQLDPPVAGRCNGRGCSCGRRRSALATAGRSRIPQPGSHSPNRHGRSGGPTR